MECSFMTMRFVFVLPGNVWRQRISRSYWNNRGKGIALSVCCSIMCYYVQCCLTWLKLPNLQKKIVGYFKCNWIMGMLFSNVILILLSIHHTWINFTHLFLFACLQGLKGDPGVPGVPGEVVIYSLGSHAWISKCLISLQSHRVAKGFTFYSISLADEVIIKYSSIYFYGEFIFL